MADTAHPIGSLVQRLLLLEARQRKVDASMEKLWLEHTQLLDKVTDYDFIVSFLHQCRCSACRASPRNAHNWFDVDGFIDAIESGK